MPTINRLLSQSTTLARPSLHPPPTHLAESLSLVLRQTTRGTGKCSVLRFNASASRATYSTLSSIRAATKAHTLMRRTGEIVFRGLPHDVDEDEVEGFFSQFGEVLGVDLKEVSYTVTVAGGYVRFASLESAEKASALDGKEVLRRPMSVRVLYELTDTIHVGNIPLGVDEDRLKALFSPCGEVIDVKIQQSLTSETRGRKYGFIRFATATAASKALKSERPLFGGQRLTVHLAKQATTDLTLWDNYAETDEWTARSIRISNLPPQVTEDQLRAEFEYCGAINLTRVWRVLSTGNSLGFGFIQFVSPVSVPRALEATKEIAGHPLRVQRFGSVRPSVLEYVPPPADPSPTNSIFIGRLPQDMNNTRLRRLFERFGKIRRALVVRDVVEGKSRGCAYVDFESPEAVERAVQHHSRLMIDGNSVSIKRSYSLPKSQRDADSTYVYPRDPLDDGRSESWEQDY
ncbi:unnamed protein product [Peniophora sp. CBMAI 1063]|nr:unnamed protein product [Peniophora sp. CBMAI 1063]